MQFDERRYRPLRTVDLFDEAFDIYKKNFVLLLAVTALVYVPMQTATSWLFLVWSRQPGHQFAATADPGAAFDYLVRVFGAMFAMSPITLVGYTLLSGALAKAISARYLDAPITVWEAYRASLRRFLANMVALLIDYAAIGVLSLCIVLFLFPLIRWLLVTPLTVLEGIGPFAALKRSSRLSANNDWRLISALTVLFTLSSIIYTALQGVLVIFTGSIFGTGALVVPAIAQNPQVASQVAGGLAQLLMFPFQMAVITLLYYDLKIRQEGYDMEILAERLGYPVLDYKTATPHAAALMAGRVAPVTIKKGRAK